MTSIEKLTVAAKNMRNTIQPWCHHLTALKIVAENECEISPVLTQLRLQIEDMRQQCYAMCCSYDKLRSILGALEIERVIENPTFYIDTEAGHTVKKQCVVTGKLMTVIQHTGV